MSTADIPQTGGKTEQINRVIGDFLRSVRVYTPTRWSLMLPVVDFALNNAVNASAGFNTFYVNGLTHPCVSLTLPLRLVPGGKEMTDLLAETSPATVSIRVSEFLATRLSILSHVRDALADSQDKQKNNMMLNAEVVLNVVRSKTKFYSRLKAHLHM